MNEEWILTAVSFISYNILTLCPYVLLSLSFCVPSFHFIANIAHSSSKYYKTKRKAERTFALEIIKLRFGVGINSPFKSTGEFSFYLHSIKL